MAGTLGLTHPAAADRGTIGGALQRAAPSPFKPAWWCRNRHLQTLWPVLFRRHPRPALRRERLELPDGDFVDLDWTLNTAGPIVILLHGLEGGSRSHYARGLLAALPRDGFRGVLMHFRGCSGEPNRLPRAYHSGETGDFNFLINLLREREPATPLAAIGFSLGGNVLLKWLGEQREHAPLAAAVAVSVPFLLHESVVHMNRGFARLYQWHLLQRLKRSVQRKAARLTPPVPLTELQRMTSFFHFDDRITGPLHGFAGAMHYYTASSSRPYLRHIRVPTLLVQSRDDPFMPDTVLPHSQDLSPTTTLSLHAGGGHVGFVGGSVPWRPRYWLDHAVPAWLRQVMDRSPTTRPSGPA